MDGYSIVKEIICGYEIEVVQAGHERNPVLVFAHGLGANLRQWRDQLDYFSEEYRVMAFSFQGHGDSSRTDDPAAYTIEAYGEVAMALLEKRKIESCAWIGNSMGGVIGLEILKKRPELIGHLVTNGTAPAIDYGPKVLKRIETVDKILMKILGFECYINIAVMASLKGTTKRRKLKDLFLAAYPQAILESHLTLGSYNYLDTIEKAHCLITIILTPEDREINKTIKDHLPRLAQMEHVTIVNGECGGHIVNMEIPEYFNFVTKRIIDGSFEGLK